jgi:hypothetical protein
MNFNSKASKQYQDLGGTHQAIFAGRCAVCNNLVFNEQDEHTGEIGAYWGEPYNPDWRGVIPANHCADTLRASEYGMTGDDVDLCAICANDKPLYNRGLELAKNKWG